MRKATFTKTDTGYQPVNKLAKVLSGGQVMAKEDVQEIAHSGVARPYVWTNGVLRQSFRG